MSLILNKLGILQADILQITNKVMHIAMIS